MPRLQDANHDRLTRAGVTEREADVLWAVAERLRNREIAVELGITEGTVKVFLHSIFEKLGVSNRTELALRSKD